MRALKAVSLLTFLMFGTSFATAKQDPRLQQFDPYITDLIKASYQALTEQTFDRQEVQKEAQECQSQGLGNPTESDWLASNSKEFQQGVIKCRLAMMSGNPATKGPFGMVMPPNEMVALMIAKDMLGKDLTKLSKKGQKNAGKKKADSDFKAAKNALLPMDIKPFINAFDDYCGDPRKAGGKCKAYMGEYASRKSELTALVENEYAGAKVIAFEQQVCKNTRHPACQDVKRLAVAYVSSETAKESSQLDDAAFFKESEKCFGQKGMRGVEQARCAHFKSEHAKRIDRAAEKLANTSSEQELKERQAASQKLLRKRKCFSAQCQIELKAYDIYMKQSAAKEKEAMRLEITKRLEDAGRDWKADYNLCFNKIQTAPGVGKEKMAEVGKIKQSFECKVARAVAIKKGERSQLRYIKGWKMALI